MGRRCLFGPVSSEFAENHLHQPRQSGECLAFNSTGTTDLAIQLADAWETIIKKLPDVWHPEFVFLDLAHARVPTALWNAAIPLVGLARNWEMLWHSYR